jgi:hypothetical protein
MRNQSEKIDDLLNDIEINCDPAIGSRACTRFSLDCLTLIRHKLPPIAEEGLAVAIYPIFENAARNKDSKLQQLIGMVCVFCQDEQVP